MTAVTDTTADAEKCEIADVVINNNNNKNYISLSSMSLSNSAAYEDNYMYYLHFTSGPLNVLLCHLCVY